MDAVDVKCRYEAGKYVPVLVFPSGAEFVMLPGKLSEDAGGIAHQLRRWRKAWADSRLRRIHDLAVGEFDDTDELLKVIALIAAS